jgi:hypothetical protein
MSKLGQRFRTIRDNYRIAKEHDPRLGWILLGLSALTLAVFIGIGAWTNNMITWVIIGVSTALLVAAIVFSRRAMRSAYRSIEGKPGAAVAVIQNMSRAGWSVTPAVAANKAQDLVHRAVGRPGVVLIGEGSSQGLGHLLTAEHKRTARFMAEVPITEITIGDGPDQVPIAKLDKHLRKMTKVLAPGEVNTVRKRLEALATMPVPMPKGPMPRSSRMPRGSKLR